MLELDEVDEPDSVEPDVVPVFDELLADDDPDALLAPLRSSVKTQVVGSKPDPRIDEQKSTHHAWLGRLSSGRQALVEATLSV